MAEPEPIPALFKLSLTALIEHVKKKRLKISPDQIPPNIHKMLWEISNVLDLIVNTCHPETRIWFSTRVIHIPPVITVTFWGGITVEHFCQVYIRFENRPMVTWTLTSPDRAELNSPKFIIRTGNQFVSTQMNENNADFITSQLPHYDRSCLEVINWICKAFRCEISELDLGYENIMLSWPRLKFANSLKIRLFGKLEDLEQLIMERKKNNLRTTLDAIWIVTPLQIELLPFIDFSTAWISFSKLKIDELIEQFRDLSTRAPCSVMAWTTNLSTEDFERFKAQLQFDNRSTTSAINRSRIKYKLGSVPTYQFAYIYNDPPNEKFYCFRDDKIVLFRFMFSEPGGYNGIIMNVF